jgi:Na+-translocating ferredoxin:NAD+ oxidoreductase subunit B
MIPHIMGNVGRLVAFVPEQRIPEEISHNFLLQAILVIALIGIVLGAVLAYGAWRFAVRENPLIEKVEDALPKGQCGACGFAGCRGYAEAVVNEPEVSPDLCIPGGEKTSREVAELTDKKAEKTVKVTSALRCVGDAEKGAPRKYIYSGIQDCFACHILLQGPFECQYCCLGLGNCQRACPHGALSMREGRPSIDRELCIGCGLCVKSCPRKCLEMVPQESLVHCSCNNPGKGGPLRKMCPSACIGCGLCAKNCPQKLIAMIGNLPVIEHMKCPGDCPMPCIDKCPTHAIAPFAQKEPK